MAGLNIEAFKQQMAGKKKTQYWSFKDGSNYIRVLPRSIQYYSPEGDCEFSFHYFRHYRVSETESIVCPKSPHIGRPCPICEKIKLLWDSTDPEDHHLARQIKKTKRVLCNVIDMDSVETGIQVLETGPQVYSEVAKWVVNPKWGDLFDITQGRSITVDKNPPKNKNDWTKYVVTPDPEPTSVKEVLPPSWQDDINLLESKLPLAKSYEEIMRVMHPDGDFPAANHGVSQGSFVPEGITTRTVANPPAKAEELVVEEELAVEYGEEEEQAPPTPRKTKAPECFGKSYSPKSKTCIPCPSEVKDKCCDAFLHSD